MSRIFWDTNLYIYLFEGSGALMQQTKLVRQRMIERKDELMTSAMTLAEIQVGPRRAGNLVLAVHLKDAVLRSSAIISFDQKAADVYAELRENPAIKPPDAIQLSCAAVAGVELFLTNDERLHRLAVPGIHFITSVGNVPFH